VKGLVLQAIVCDCEEEGYVRLRVARDPKKGWSYDPKDASTFVDIHGLEPRDAFRKVRVGEWADARVICFGHLKRVWSKRVERVGRLLESGARLVGEAHVGDGVTIDFGLFEAELTFEDGPTRAKFLRDSGIRAGSFVATDVGVDIEIKRWGTREQILRR